MGDVISDLNSRQGKIELMDSSKSSGFKLVKAKVPLGKMFGYATTLRSRTKGRGIYNMTFYGYSDVPKQLYAELTKN